MTEGGGGGRGEDSTSGRTRKSLARNPPLPWAAEMLARRPVVPDTRVKAFAYWLMKCLTGGASWSSVTGR